MNNKQILALAILTLTALAAYQQANLASAELDFPDPVTIKDVDTHGLVLDEYGQMVPDCTVSVTVDGNTYSAITDINGIYDMPIISQLSLPQTVTIQASRAGYDIFETTYQITDDGNTQVDQVLDIELVKGLTYRNKIFTGTVTDYLSKDPLADATVTITQHENVEYMDGNIPYIIEEQTVIGQTTTSANGYYFLDTGLYQGDADFVIYRITVVKSGYPDYDEFTRLDYPDYALTNVKLIDLSYFILRGTVKGNNESGLQQTLPDAIIQITDINGNSLANTSTDENGKYLIYYDANPTSSYTVNVYCSGYYDISGTYQATAGIHESDPILDFIPLEESGEGWFSALFSSLKEKAWEALDQYLTNEDNFGATKNFQKTFDIPNVGEASIDVDLTYSAAYEVTVEIVAEPFGNRPGSYIGINVPIPGLGELVQARIRLGATFRFFDRDHDITTFDHVMVVDQIAVGGSVYFGFELDLEKLIKLVSGKSEEEMKDLMDQLEDLEEKLDGFIDLPELSFSIGIEAGFFLYVNGVPNSQSFGMVVDSISLLTYVHVSLEFEFSVSAKLKIHLTDWLKFSLAEGEFKVSFNFEFNLYPFEAIYHFYENRLELKFLKIEIDPPTFYVNFSWSVLNGLYKGDEILVNYRADFLDITIDWIFTTNIVGETANNAAYFGIVKNENGNPLSGANVKIYDIGQDYIKETITDSDGNYYINEVTPFSSGEFSLRVSKTGYITSSYISVPAQIGFWENDVTLSPDVCAFTGKVYFGSTAITGARVDVKDSAGIVLTTTYSSSDPLTEGRFTTADLPTISGYYYIVISKAGYVTTTRSESATYGTHNLGDISLSWAKVTYQGNVKDDTSGTPISSMKVQVKTTSGSYIETAYTNIYGNYVISENCIVNGQYYLVFSKSGFVTKTISVDADAGTRTYNVVVSHTKVRYNGYVKNNIGVKLSSALVRVYKNGVEIARDYTDSNGYYLTPYMDTTLYSYYKIVFSKSGYSTSSYYFADADYVGTRRYDRTLTASSTIRIYGYVKNEYGRNLAYARLEVYGNNVLMKSYTASSTGYFSFYVENGLTSSYKVYARHDSYIDMYKTVSSTSSSYSVFYLYDYHGVVPLF